MNESRHKALIFKRSGLMTRSIINPFISWIGWSHKSCFIERRENFLQQNLTSLQNSTAPLTSPLLDISLIEYDSQCSLTEVYYRKLNFLTLWSQQLSCQSHYYEPCMVKTFSFLPAQLLLTYTLFYHGFHSKVSHYAEHPSLNHGVNISSRNFPSCRSN